MNEVYGELLGLHLPARSTIQAPLPFGALVALDAIALTAAQPGKRLRPTESLSSQKGGAVLLRRRRPFLLSPLCLLI